MGQAESRQVADFGVLLGDLITKPIQTISGAATNPYEAGTAVRQTALDENNSMFPTANTSTVGNLQQQQEDAFANAMQAALAQAFAVEPATSSTNVPVKAPRIGPTNETRTEGKKVWAN